MVIRNVQINDPAGGSPVIASIGSLAENVLLESTDTKTLANLIDNDLDDFQGAVHGLVPAPASGDNNKYLKSDGTWGNIEDSLPTISNTQISSLFT